MNAPRNVANESSSTWAHDTNVVDVDGVFGSSSQADLGFALKSFG